MLYVDIPLTKKSSFFRLMYFGFHLHFLSHFEDFQEAEKNRKFNKFLENFACFFPKWKAIAQGQKTIHGLKHQK